MISFVPIVEKGFRNLRPVLFPLIPSELMVVTSSTTSTGAETVSGSLNTSKTWYLARSAYKMREEEDDFYEMKI